MAVNMQEKPEVLLIPWDPCSPPHVERMIQQRITCGWDDQAVTSWTKLQESGELNLQWIVLPESHHHTLLKHTTSYPQEREPLLDSALSFGGKPREIPAPQRTFIPIGHICLGRPSRDSVKKGYVEDSEGLYWISNFYISRAVQGSGLGRAAMDTVEHMAISEPLNARLLGLNAINKDDPGRDIKYTTLGISLPKFSNQEWYERRGYVVYKHVDKLFSQVDETGKAWYWDAVFLKKEICE